MIDQATLRELLDYDPSSGVFQWRRRDVRWFSAGKQTSAHNCAIWNGKHAGKIAGHVNALGYVDIRVFRDLIDAHRLAWLFMTGEWPPEEVDHRDCDKSNNRWANLRLASHAENGCNTRIRKNNTSGFKGVHRYRDRWRARISLNRKYVCLGFFSTPEEAHLAYSKAAAKLHGEFAKTG